MSLSGNWRLVILGTSVCDVGKRSVWVRAESPAWVANVDQHVVRQPAETYQIHCPASPS